MPLKNDDSPSKNGRLLVQLEATRDAEGGRVGVLPWGLGDGARPTVAGAYVVVGGVRARIIAVSLEYTTIDLSGTVGVVVGDVATVVGVGAVGIEEWAEWSGCSPLEMMCSAGGRMPVVAVN